MCAVYFISSANFDTLFSLVCLLLFFFNFFFLNLFTISVRKLKLSTSKVMAERVPLTCDSTYSWRLHSAAQLGNQSSNIMTGYPTKSHYPDTEPTSPFPVQIMLSAWLRSDKYTFLSHWSDSTKVRTREVWIPRSPKMGDRCSTHPAIPIWSVMGWPMAGLITPRRWWKWAFFLPLEQDSNPHFLPFWN